MEQKKKPPVSGKKQDEENRKASHEIMGPQLGKHQNPCYRYDPRWPSGRRDTHATVTN